MEYEITIVVQILIWIISFLVALLVIWSTITNNKKHVDAATSNQVNGLLISDYKIQTSSIELLKATVILAVDSLFFIIIPTSLIVMYAAEIWPTSFFWLLVMYIALFILGFGFTLLFLLTNIFLRPYPQTIFYHEFSGLLRRQGNYVWTLAQKPFIVVDAIGISGRITLPWKRVSDVKLLDDKNLLISYNRCPSWLVRMLKADSFILIVEDGVHAKKIVNFWHFSRNSNE